MIISVILILNIVINFIIIKFEKKNITIEKKTIILIWSDNHNFNFNLKKKL
jgi:hypothetical protein